MRYLFCLLFMLGFAACLELSSDFDPMVGEAKATRCINEDSDPNTDVSFSGEILPMLMPAPGKVGCGCHMPSQAEPIGIQQSGLDLSSYAKLKNGGNNSGSEILVPGDACSSILWQKISPGPPFGARMPFNGPPFLTKDEIRLIADWIVEGANDN